MNQSDIVLPTVSSQSQHPLRAISEIEVGSMRPRHRFESIERSTPGPLDEALVVDERSHLRPAQVVETKLTRMAKDASLPVSHLQMRGLLRSR
jgi:hypothetical protein